MINWLLIACEVIDYAAVIILADYLCNKTQCGECYVSVTQESPSAEEPQQNGVASDQQENGEPLLLPMLWLACCVGDDD